MTTRTSTLPQSRRSTPDRNGTIAMSMAVAPIALAVALAIALAGCRKPQPPDPDVPPEPQAAGTAATTSPSTATAASDVAAADARGDVPRTVESRAVGRDVDDGHQTALERVRDVETKVGDAADRTRATIDPP